MVAYRGILTGLTKSTDHPSTPSINMEGPQFGCFAMIEPLVRSSGNTWGHVCELRSVVLVSTKDIERI